jgi:NADH-quinone oxidoreductase subunit N
MLMMAASEFWLPTTASLGRLGPMWALIATIVALLIGPMIFGRRPVPTAMLALFGGALTLLASVMAAGQSAWVGLAPPGDAPMLLADNFSAFIGVLISMFLIAVTLLWLIGYRSGAPRSLMHDNSPEFFVLLTGSALGMLLMVSTTHLLMIAIAVEMASLPSYVLAGFDKRNRKGAEASLKYVLFGGITSAIMIYGISLMYGYYGTMDLTVIARQIAAGETAGTMPAMALFALLVGVGFKISTVPFHFWCPDVFEGAAVEVTTWLSVASKAAGLGLAIRILSLPAAVGMDAGSAFSEGLVLGVGIFAALSATIGNLSALHQSNVKRMLAYSSIAHAGYMLMGAAILVGIGENGVHPGFTALAAYLIVYLFMNLGAFGVVAMVYWSTGREDFQGFSGLGRRHAPLAVMMTIFLVSLVGLPPFGGFAAKYWLLINLAEAELYWLIVVAALNTALSLYYYVRLVRQMWLVDDGQPAVAAPMGGVAIAGACSVVILLTGTLYVGKLRSVAERCATGLYVGQAMTAPPIKQYDTPDDAPPFAAIMPSTAE